ncbi:hypothetical protein LCGC14_0967160 [marine sediment metagenome]|uniref:Uncharacterized protein n=1 Tax=marine sediment metagenome TaxID=412755 RepID=A0A0F9NYY8_9ZZZZ
MPEGNGSNESKPFYPFGQSLGSENLSKDLTGFDKKIGDSDNKTTLRKLFITLTRFADSKEADSYATTIAKCFKHKQYEFAEELILKMMAKVSIKGEGRREIINVLTQIYEEAENARPIDTRKAARKPGQVTA